ncbi:MAG TPA: T9SS type A sorting domain-containing protein [Chitinophagales bacterium]|nr:T9SS type A sorting domain-containing protein [Chitinophagales bacterium]
MEKKILLVLVLTINTSVAFAQSDLLAHFSGRQIENYIHLDFTVHGGITCSGTEVQRSTDSIHFETIGTIPGVCGSSNFDVSYSFDDSLPVKNQFNYYRINFGQFGYSKVIKLWYVDYGNEFVVVSNTIFFSNPNHENLTLSIFNLQGQMIQSWQTYGDAVSLDWRVFPSRMYFFQVRNAQKILFSGKFVYR